MKRLWVGQVVANVELDIGIEHLKVGRVIPVQTSKKSRTVASRFDILHKVSRHGCEVPTDPIRRPRNLAVESFHQPLFGPIAVGLNG